MPKKTPKTKKRARPKKTPKTAAIVVADKQPIAQPVVSVAPSIERAVGRIEQVRKFVVRGLNQSLQQYLKAHPKAPQDDPKRAELAIDYGVIPGKDKKFLLQPGAEKICLWLNVRPVYDSIEKELEGGHLEVVVRCKLLSKETNEEVFSGPSCSCSTMETKYRYQHEKRDTDKTPGPSQDEAKKLKALGLGHWRKNKFPKQGESPWEWWDRVESPNISDSRNTVRQMAHKRALVKVVRNFGAMSEIFTEDPSEWNFDGDEGGTPPDDGKQFTRGGREIVVQDTGGSQAAADAVAAKKVAEYQASKPVSLRYDAAGKLAYIWGNKPVIEEAGKICFIMWLDAQKEWGIELGDLPKLQAVCEQHKVKLEVVKDLDVAPAAAQGRATEAPASKPAPAHIPTKREQGRTQAPADQCANIPAAPDLAAPLPSPGRDGDAQVAGTPKGGGSVAGPSESPALSAPGMLQHAKEGETKNQKIPVLNCRWKGIYLSCFDKKLWDYLKAGVGKEAELVLSENKMNVVGIRRIGERRFDENGLPEIQMGEDRKPAAQLFD